MTAGTDLIAAERDRQMTAERYTAEHDQGHAEQLGWAAMAYAGAGVYVIRGEGSLSVQPPWWWPWSTEYWKPTGDPVRDLTKAGALIAAAIDSLVAEREPNGSETATCPKCGATVTDQTPSEFYLSHDARCGGDLQEPSRSSSGEDH